MSTGYNKAGIAVTKVENDHITNLLFTKQCDVKKRNIVSQ